MFGVVPGTNDGMNFNLPAGRERTNRWEDVPVKTTPPGDRPVPAKDPRMRPWWAVAEARNRAPAGGDSRRMEVVQFGDLKSSDDAMVRAVYENVEEYNAFKGEFLRVKHDRCLQVHDARMMNYLEHRFHTLGPFYTPSMHGRAPPAAAGVGVYIADLVRRDEATDMRLRRALVQDNTPLVEEEARKERSLWEEYEAIDRERGRTLR